MAETSEMYQRVAKAFALKIQTIFQSEQSLQACFTKHFARLSFDRTNHWQAILLTEFADSWIEHGPEVKAHPTPMDQLEVLKRLYVMLDYNLFTQILLNFQAYTGIAYRAADAQKELDAFKEKYKHRKLSPFSEKPKTVKNAASEEEKEFNQDLSAIRALKIIADFTPMYSFRVSPMGSTPAFADSKNLSMIGAGGDKYLTVLPQLCCYFVTWAPSTAPNLLTLVGTAPEGVQFTTPGIEYKFTSKSGGEVLNETLFARLITQAFFPCADNTKEYLILLPRMNSVMVVADKYNTRIRMTFERLKAQYPMLELHEGTRYGSDGAASQG